MFYLLILLHPLLKGVIISRRHRKYHSAVHWIDRFLYTLSRCKSRELRAMYVANNLDDLKDVAESITVANKRSLSLSVKLEKRLLDCIIHSDVLIDQYCKEEDTMSAEWVGYFRLQFAHMSNLINVR